MKLAFIADGPVFEKDGSYYEYAYHNLYERYSYIADEIRFLMRTKPLGSNSSFTKVPSEIGVIGVPDTKSIEDYFKNGAEAKEIVQRCVSECDVFVLRLPSVIAETAQKYIEAQGKPYIIECVGCAWDSYWNHSLLGKFVAPIEFFRTKRAIARADYVYYVTTKFLQSRYPAKKGARTVCCSNVVLDAPSDKALNRRLDRMSHRSKDSSRLVLGTAAALDTRYKGQEYVIRAIPILESLGYDVKYRLAGGKNRNQDDTYLADIAEHLGVTDKVEFVGALSKKDMSAFYESLDVYVQPSKQEGLPRAVIEAMATGCPCIGTNIAGIPELIQSELLFKKGSVDGVVAAVKRLMGMNLSEIAKQNYITSTQYTYEILDMRRSNFYDQFKKECLDI